MRLLPDIGYELAATIRRVNAASRRNPNAAGSKIAESWTALEEDVDRHCTSGDAASARSAIERWESSMLSLPGPGGRSVDG